jgi:hypothetical protein
MAGFIFAGLRYLQYVGGHGWYYSVPYEAESLEWDYARSDDSYFWRIFGFVFL